MSEKKKRGVIVTYNARTQDGKVRVQGRKYRFRDVNFTSQTDRSPRRDQQVEVVFSHTGRVMEVILL